MRGNIDRLGLDPKTLQLKYMSREIDKVRFTNMVSKAYLSYVINKAVADEHKRKESLYATMKMGLSDAEFKDWRIGYESNQSIYDGSFTVGLPKVNSYVILAMQEERNGSRVCKLRIAQLVQHLSDYGLNLAFKYYSEDDDIVILKDVICYSLFGAWRRLMSSEVKKLKSLGCLWELNGSGYEIDLKIAMAHIGEILDTNIRLSCLTEIRLPVNNSNIVAYTVSTGYHFKGEYKADKGLAWIRNGILWGNVRFVDMLNNSKVTYREYKGHDYFTEGQLVKVYRIENSNTNTKTIVSYVVHYQDTKQIVQYSLTTKEVKEALKFGQRIKGLKLGYNGTRVLLDKS